MLITGFKINDFIKAGINTSVYLADWHSFINNKFSGNDCSIGTECYGNGTFDDRICICNDDYVGHGWEIKHIGGYCGGFPALISSLF